MRDCAAVDYLVGSIRNQAKAGPNMNASTRA